MQKYLQYLLGDIEQLIEQAPVQAEQAWIPGYSEEREIDDLQTRLITLKDLIGLPAESFPPEHLLTELQIIELVENIQDLWTAWNIHWDMPLDLSIRKHYTALVKEIEGDPIYYHPELGGDVHICNFDGGKSCPFKPGDNQCPCRELEESAKHDIALWEEYVRSQGLDPYREMTSEEVALFEEEMRQRELKKSQDKDWQKFDFTPQHLFEQKLDDEEQAEFLQALEVADELLGIILDNLDNLDLDMFPDEEEDDSSATEW